MYVTCYNLRLSGPGRGAGGSADRPGEQQEPLLQPSSIPGTLTSLMSHFVNVW